MYAHHGQIIELFGVADERVHSPVHILQDLLRGETGDLIERCFRSAETEHFTVLVGGLGKSVRIKKELASAFKLKGVVIILRIRHTAQNEAVLVLEYRKAAAGRPDDGIFVTCAGRGEPACRDLQDTDPHGDEHFFRVAGKDRLVGFLQDLFRGSAEHGTALQDDLCGHHEQGGRDSFPGDICHDQAKAVIVYQKEIIEIAADLSRRGNTGADLKLPSVRERLRHHGGLYPACQGELGVYPFLFGGDPGQVLHIGGKLLFHLRHGTGQILHFIPGVDLQIGKMLCSCLTREMVFRITLRCFGDLVDRIRNGLFHVPGEIPCDQSGYYKAREDDLQGVCLHSVNEFCSRHVGEYERDSLARIVFDGITGGTHPTVVVCPADVIEHARAVPVQELPDFLPGNAFPFTGGMDDPAQIDDIDKRVVCFVIHAHIDEVHIVRYDEGIQDIFQGGIIAAPGGID